MKQLCKQVYITLWISTAFFISWTFLEPRFWVILIQNVAMAAHTHMTARWVAHLSVKLALCNVIYLYKFTHRRGQRCRCAPMARKNGGLIQGGGVSCQCTLRGQECSPVDPGRDYGSLRKFSDNPAYTVIHTVQLHCVVNWSVASPAMGHVSPLDFQQFHF